MSSGAPQEYVFVYKLRDGLIGEYRTTQQALEAVGLTELDAQRPTG